MPIFFCTWSCVLLSCCNVILNFFNHFNLQIRILILKSILFANSYIWHMVLDRGDVFIIEFLKRRLFQKVHIIWQEDVFKEIFVYMFKGRKNLWVPIMTWIKFNKLTYNFRLKKKKWPNFGLFWKYSCVTNCSTQPCIDPCLLTCL